MPKILDQRRFSFSLVFLQWVIHAFRSTVFLMHDNSSRRGIQGDGSVEAHDEVPTSFVYERFFFGLPDAHDDVYAVLSGFGDALCLLPIPSDRHNSGDWVANVKKFRF